jgi:uncharacterized protein (DUF2141 family)
MKRRVAFAVIASASAASLAALSFAAAKEEQPHMTCTGAPNEVLIVVKDVKKSVGLITAELYRNDEATFLSKEGRELRVRVAAKAPVTRFCIHAPNAESYAMAIYHDKNANEKFDKGPLGMPAEPYGLSNNPRIKLAPPPVSAALFPVADDGTTVEILLNN